MCGIQAICCETGSEGEGTKRDCISGRVMCRPRPNSSRCFERGRRRGMWEVSILLPFKFNDLSVEGRFGMSSVRSSAESISCDLESAARFKYTKDVAAGCVHKNSTTEEPSKNEHLLRLRCVSFAVLGIDWRAEEVMRVCATSKCVRCFRRGRRISNVEDGRMVHSCRLSLVIGRVAGRLGEDKERVKASRKLADEQAQKSSAFNRGKSQNKAVRTSELRSLSTCSCAKNSLK